MENSGIGLKKHHVGTENSLWKTEEKKIERNISSSYQVNVGYDGNKYMRRVDYKPDEIFALDLIHGWFPYSNSISHNDPPAFWNVSLLDGSVRGTTSRDAWEYLLDEGGFLANHWSIYKNALKKIKEDLGGLKTKEN